MSEIKGNILWADEDIDYMDPYVEYFTLKGLYVKTVSNPEQFFDSLKILKWDLFILDMMFPRGSIFSRQESDGGKRTGLQMLKRLKGDTKSKDIPIIIRTGITNNQEIVDECIAAGLKADCFFEKPGNLFKFYQKIVFEIKLYQAVNE